MKGRLVLLIAVLGFAGEVLAAGFAVVGPRALGMGGAQVAVVDDTTAVYWNPAAIAGYNALKLGFPLGVQVVEHNDITDTLSDIDDVLGDYDLDEPEVYLDEGRISRLVELFRKLDEPGTGVEACGNIGLVASRGNIAFGVIDLAYFGGWVTMDLDRVEIGDSSLPNSIANNESSLTVLGFESRELSVSYAKKIWHLLVGGNVKQIFGRSYYKYVNVAEDRDVEGGLEEMSSSSLAFDAGLLYHLPGGQLKAGLVVRNVNSPSFSYEGGEIELKSQVRAGVAYEMNENLLMACDLDITENETMTTGYDDRKLAFGIEKKVLAESVALRGGIYKNIAESDADPVITAGLGVGARELKFDLGVGVNLDFDELAFSLALSTVF